MKLQNEHAEKIHEFYGWLRDHQADASVSSEGEASNVSNFGYWDESCNNLFDANMALLELIVERISPLNQGDNGLDMGCGLGGYAGRILEKFPVSMTAYDLLQDHLNITRQFSESRGVADRLTTIQGSSMNLAEIPDESMDFAYCIESSFHYDDKQKFFDEMHRVLKPGARFVYADITCEDISKITFKSGNYFSSQAEIDGYIDCSAFNVLETLDIGPNVFIPLQDYKKYFDSRVLPEVVNPNKIKVAKYWALVFNNYVKLYKQGLMGYLIYCLQK